MQLGFRVELPQRLVSDYNLRTCSVSDWNCIVTGMRKKALTPWLQRKVQTPLSFGVKPYNSWCEKTWHVCSTVKGGHLSCDSTTVQWRHDSCLKWVLLWVSEMTRYRDILFQTLYRDTEPRHRIFTQWRGVIPHGNGKLGHTTVKT